MTRPWPTLPGPCFPPLSFMWILWKVRDVFVFPGLGFVCLLLLTRFNTLSEDEGSTVKLSDIAVFESPSEQMRERE